MRSFVTQNQGVPRALDEQRKALRSGAISRIRLFELGPEGTNISKASHEWAKEMGISRKVEHVLVRTPEEAIRRARDCDHEDVLGVAWTCAVYARESHVFFGNPDFSMFMFQWEMELDHMMLAAPKDSQMRISGGGDNVSLFPRSACGGNWTIAAHPSPQHLLAGEPVEITCVDSNAAAAIEAKEGRVQGCITTESARKLHRLHCLFDFGCPTMVFFGGVTAKGSDMLAEAWQQVSRAA